MSTIQMLSKEEDEKNRRELSSALTSNIGVIVPPPEIKAIIDKTSRFVAKNGITFEEKIRSNEANNPKFNFLNAHDPYYAYYRSNIAALSRGQPLATDKIHDLGLENGVKKEDSTVKPNDKSNYEKFTAVQAQQYKPDRGEALIRSVAKFIDINHTINIPEQFPPNYEFIFEPPNMPIGDIEIIRMTAQFVAKGGQSFLNNLMEREKRNYFFDFLKPQHACFNFFNAMVDQYSKIITPSINKLKELDESSYNLDKMIKRVKDRYYYEKISSENENKEAEELEKERIAFAQIDWNDFVIVEQINFKEDDKLTLPEPVTLEALGDRILHQQRLLEEQAEASTKESEAAKSDEIGVKEEDKPIIVVKDYDPKKTKRPPGSLLPSSNLGSVDTSMTKSSVQMMISPITGELIPSDSLAEHMKVSLLDPRWKEEKKRLIEERQKQNDVFVTGDTVSSYLKDLAQHRSDIFGDNATETRIGRKITKESLFQNVNNSNTISAEHQVNLNPKPIHITKPETKPVFDQKTNYIQKPTPESLPNIPPSIPSNNSYNNNASMVNLSQPSNQLSTPILPDQSKPTIPPNTGVINMPNNNIPGFVHSMPPPAQTMPINMGMPPAPSPHIPMHMNMPPPISTLPPLMPQQNMNPPNNLVPPPNLHVPPPTTIVPPVTNTASTTTNTAPQPIPQQPLNKPMIRSQIFSEINIHVQITFSPEVAQKFNWRFEAPVVTYHIDLSWPVSKLKTMISESSGMPGSKQKLSTFQGTFLKDSNNLGFYHLVENSMLYLHVKERGGR